MMHERDPEGQRETTDFFLLLRLAVEECVGWRTKFASLSKPPRMTGGLSCFFSLDRYRIV
jgi:hypothetical protein